MNNTTDHLPPGTRVDQYIIEQTLSRGGFSIVYLARVSGMEKQVAIKEYMPGRLAVRNPDLSVIPASEEDVEKFNRGRKLFFKEASTLGKIKHRSIVNVFNFFSANGTAYMVMEYRRGENLEKYIKKYNGNLSEKFLMTIFPPLMKGLRVIHKAGITHQDIKPANIHIRPGGKPLLLDFGAIHQMLSKSKNYHKSQIVSAGFAPIEQYENKGYLGPWTDIYALGATMRACIEGKPPPPANERRKHDKMKPAAQAFRKKYSPELLSAIDWAMEIDPLHRPQTVDELLRAVRDRRPPEEKPDTGSSMLKKFRDSFFIDAEDG